VQTPEPAPPAAEPAPNEVEPAGDLPPLEPEGQPL